MNKKSKYISILAMSLFLFNNVKLKALEMCELPNLNDVISHTYLSDSEIKTLQFIRTYCDNNNVFVLNTIRVKSSNITKNVYKEVMNDRKNLIEHLLIISGKHFYDHWINAQDNIERLKSTLTISTTDVEKDMLLKQLKRWEDIEQKLFESANIFQQKLSTEMVRLQYSKILHLFNKNGIQSVSVNDYQNLGQLQETLKQFYNLTVLEINIPVTIQPTDYINSCLDKYKKINSSINFSPVEYQNVKLEIFNGNISAIQAAKLFVGGNININEDSTGVISIYVSDSGYRSMLTYKSQLILPISIKADVIYKSASNAFSINKEMMLPNNICLDISSGLNFNMCQ